MRLLEVKADGSYSLTRALRDDDLPEYAILSYTWEADDQEVTFEDLVRGTGLNKRGYGKIQFATERTIKDGLHYIWVDSCCIDKSSSAELMHSINFMFRWYQNAQKCYVYLSDVSTSKRKANDLSADSTWESAFSKSKWFTRGWTLQELIAPNPVIFFSREQKLLGDKDTLEQPIFEITGIPIDALRGKSLFEFTVDERRSWANNRETTFKEDRAYCLLGIFKVSLPVIYGEGFDNAFARLDEAIDRRSKVHTIGKDNFTPSEWKITSLIRKQIVHE
jgi:hypothetical protein